jgi:hypothetical protein
MSARIRSFKSFRAGKWAAAKMRTDRISEGSPSLGAPHEPPVPAIAEFVRHGVLAQAVLPEQDSQGAC